MEFNRGGVKSIIGADIGRGSLPKSQFVLGSMMSQGRWERFGSKGEDNF